MDVHCELRRDPESHRLWGLEMLNHTIIGCAGPFQDEGAVQEEFDPAAPFERNAELLRWLGRRNLERIAALRATRRWGRHPLQE